MAKNFLLDDEDERDEPTPSVKRPRKNPVEENAVVPTVKKRGRPRKYPVSEDGEVIKPKRVRGKVKERDELDRNWTGLYDIIRHHDPNDQDYGFRQGSMDSAQTRLFDKIVNWMEKKFYEVG
jgi:hypothetical protein